MNSGLQCGMVLSLDELRCGNDLHTPRAGKELVVLYLGEKYVGEEISVETILNYMGWVYDPPKAHGHVRMQLIVE